MSLFEQASDRRKGCPLLYVSAHDRHVVGRSCFDEGDVANGIAWWASSMDTLELEGDEPSEDRMLVLESMSRLTMRLQDKTAAFRLLIAYQDGAPTHLRAKLVARAQAESCLRWSFLASDAARFESMCSPNHTSSPGASPSLRCLILHIITALRTDKRFMEYIVMGPPGIGAPSRHEFGELRQK
ncbi:hypothetical protein HPB51_009423 [Rhipicephalus microplus]|uniref:Uncharacterized protein n=1 Tax=Rhipicephalus microplus TaxID=6941 RepID=A0A9J6E0B3_RHIMP|nr:hypothetical protein HPB51_009423 [Rhipicephalus microplus]